MWIKTTRGEKCDTCRNVYTLVCLEDGKYSCVDCKKAKDAAKAKIFYPTLTITTPVNADPLAISQVHNETERRTEWSMRIIDFVDCGWFIRKIETPVMVSGLTKTRYILEYHGGVACHRVKGIQYPLGTTQCSNFKSSCISCFNY